MFLFCSSGVTIRERFEKSQFEPFVYLTTKLKIDVAIFMYYVLITNSRGQMA